jgi:hypothetical protein
MSKTQSFLRFAEILWKEGQDAKSPAKIFDGAKVVTVSATMGKVSMTDVLKS